MEKTVGKKIPVSVIKITITTVRKCPYNPETRWCMYYPFDANVNKKPITVSVRSIMHELLHMMLHYYYEDYIKEQGVSEIQFHHLKEAQTIILNSIYKDYLTEPDKGYEIHKQLREDFLVFWEENKNFNDFVNYNISRIGEYFPNSKESH